MPRKANLPYLKNLAKNPYIFPVVKTIQDEATNTEWEIKVKEEFNDGSEDYTEKIKEITKFFKNPNENYESWDHITKQLITDLCELDSAVLVKVFNRNKEMTQVVSRDGATFLKNPTIYGMIGDRADFVPPLPAGFTDISISPEGTRSVAQNQLINQYNILFRQDAAYFQYGWTAGSMPIPFGKREIIYIIQNPRADSIYGRSPIEVLTEIIQNLIYGVDFNLDFYTNNNMPEGVISLLGAQPGQIKQFRENWQKQFRFTDALGKKRKRFFQFPISSTEVKFTPFQLSSKDMEIIGQQTWFTKLLWMCFGVTADEMGFTESSNKTNGEEQTKAAGRKAIKPMLKTLQYHFNTQILPEFFAKDGQVPNFSDIPLEFKYDDYDITEEMAKYTLWEKQINMGIKTPEMVAKEAGIDLEELNASLSKVQDSAVALLQAESNINNNIPGQEDKENPKEKKAEKKEEPKKKDPKKVEEKSKNPDLLKEIEV